MRKIIALLSSLDYFSLFFLKKIYLAVLGLSCTTSHMGSVVALHGLSSCGTQASGVAVSGLCPRACGILVPGPGVEPASHTLQDRFLTTGSPGKSCFHLF